MSKRSKHSHKRNRSLQEGDHSSCKIKRDDSSYDIYSNFESPSLQPSNVYNTQNASKSKAF